MPEALYVAIVGTFGAIAGSVLTLVIARYFDKPKDDASLVQQYQDIAKQATEALHLEKQDSAARDAKRTEEYTKVQERLRLVEAATYGPFRITLDFTTHPLGIQNQRIELIVLKDDASAS